MHRKWILEKLKYYKTWNSQEDINLQRLIKFIQGNKDCFSSQHPPIRGAELEKDIGHITGSAWIVNAHSDKALLTHHRKLNKWIQLGGHSDGRFNVLETAMREAHEESGIASIRPITEQIFDLDVHEIPSKDNISPHLHYDIRFLLECPDTEHFIVSVESLNLKWMTPSEISQYCGEDSVLRMSKKWQHFCQQTTSRYKK